MRKNIFLYILFTTILFCIPLYIKADYDAVINGSDVRIRSGATTNSKILYSVNSNTALTVVDKTLYEGDGCSSKWYKVIYKNKTGYVCSKYIKFVNNSLDGINVTGWTARVNANNVSVRKSTSTSSTSLDTLTLGVNVTILSTESASNGCSSGKWHKIQYYGNKTGYICSSYVTSKSDITSSDASYESTLRSAGFPDSYIPYLTYLHNKYPNWNFVAKNLNKSFSTAVSSEEGKCYMQTTNDSYRTSNKPAESTTWFKVNSAVIAFYMDPRNWLNEERIFMFEKLDYDSNFESSYPSLVKSIFGNGKLSDDLYTNAIFNAGKTNHINPVYIASRIRQEVTENGNDSTNGVEFKFGDETYSGYYNFFNIGAFEDTINGVKYNAVHRGLLYAAKLVDKDGNRSLWNDVQVAITEGSSFLANGYVTKGQGTIYYQKFNVSPDAYYDSYTHQYMTNIQAPATEGNKTYSSYKSKSLLNESFIFEIPVYNNMPEYTSLPNVGNSNNNLKSLEVVGYSLSSEFDSDVLTYEVWIPSSVNKVTIKASTENSASTLEGTGDYELVNDDTDITITVTAENGTVKKYIVSIRRVNDSTTVDNVVKAANLNVNGNYVLKIKNKTTVSSFKSSLISSGAKEITIKNSKGTVLSDKDYVATSSTLTISTLLENKTYTLVVNGDTSGDGQITILDLLQIQKYIKGSGNLSAPSLLAGDTSKDNKVTILDLLQVQKHIKGVKSL